LTINGIEAMASVTERPRELLIRSYQHEADQVLVAVHDVGRDRPGADQPAVHRLLHYQAA
jgi:hypothetical protein